ncbi:hypothetical protein OE88DRAFT_1564233 [Heliocybe sulcata]|uniref:Fungal-type protein kinase domain-containing protein n=1 Tax=Heliocybe sulcata TaxID=5364 RepID=A0A5C3N305_9AGAM|nr:hypothetical protein OE88DRAFT_1564233 [Heliocybe sulcata]
MKRMRSDSVAGLPAPSGDENRLVFRRHDPTPILSEHIGVDNYLLAGPTVRKPDVVGSTLRNALLTVKDNAKRQPMPGESWDKAWERYTNGLALSKPEIASSFGTLLVNLEFKRTAARMRSIPLEFKAGTEASGGLSVMASEASENDRVGQKRKSDGGSGVPSKRSKSKVVAGRSNNKSEKKDGEGEGEGEGRSKGRNESRAIQYETGIHEEDPDEAVLKLPPEIQIAIYAAERLSSSVAINHSFQFIINNSAISLWWFDRGSAIRSEEIDFITGLPYLVVLIDILRRFDEHAWGFNRTFRKTGTDDGKLQIDLTPLNKNQSSVTVTLDEKSHARPIYLFGRSTDVIPVRGTDVRPTWLGSSSEFVLKVYHPDEQRDSEVKILEKAYDVAFSNVKDSEYVRGHLPVLCASSDFEDEYAERITKILGISRETKQRCFRRLRVILFRRLHHIYELSGQEFLGAFIDCFRCHGVLWLNKVHHRDISEDNLMYTKVNGHVVGVLNDFDLSIYHDDDRSLANERTGTIPFMAHALLTAFRSGKPVAHLYV